MLVMMIQCDSCDRTTVDRWVHPTDSAETMARGLEAEIIQKGWIRTDEDCPIPGAGWRCPLCQVSVPEKGEA